MKKIHRTSLTSKRHTPKQIARRLAISIDEVRAVERTALQKVAERLQLTKRAAIKFLEAVAGC